MTRLSEAILHNTRGVVLTLADPHVTALLRTHVDFFVIDCAARVITVDRIETLLHAAGDVPVLVRTENAKNSTLQKYLNLGVDGLIIPDLQFATEVEKAVAGCLYPPEGIRPYRANKSTEYGLSSNLSLAALNDQVTLVLEIGHPQTIAQLEEIAEVAGIDGWIVHPERLAVAMEKELATDDTDVLNALERIRHVAQGYELPFGWEGELAEEQLANFQVVTSDLELLAAGAKAYFPKEETRSLGAADLNERQEREEAANLLRALR